MASSRGVNVDDRAPSVAAEYCQQMRGVTLKWMAQASSTDAHYLPIADIVVNLRRCKKRARIAVIFVTLVVALASR